MKKLKTIDGEVISLEFLFKNQNVNPKRQVKSDEHVAKLNSKSISNWGVFCNFSLAPMTKYIKRLRNIYTYVNSLLKT